MSIAALLAAQLLAAFPAPESGALPVRVESKGCPSSIEVEQALTAVLAPAPGTRERDLAHVERRGNRLRIKLVDATANVIAERELEAQGSCAELAQLAAIVIATWESDVHPEYVRPHSDPQAPATERPPAEKPPTEKPPTEKSPTEKSQSPVIPPSGKSTPEASLPSPPAPPHAVAPSGPARRAGYDVAVGAALSMAGSVAPGGTLALTWVPRGRGPGVRLFGVVEAERTLDLGVGKAHWQRWRGGADLAWRLPTGAASLDLHGGIVLGRLTVNGEGFQESLSHLALAPAVSAGARLAGGWSKALALWLDVTGLYWTRRQRVFGEPLAQERAIPQFEGLVSVGVALGRPGERR